mmetsp:Transcript_3382/g.5163  ORF Transcript_3382/g.5163 Transcript_3382/m.5163 type:complete len:553 (-) Transcript_3382:330-1988(-)
MAISKIKHDNQGNPDRAKYCIVALGNLDPHQWNSSDCFAPVLSSLELGILMAIATQLRCLPKSGDVSQAFVQSTLPSDEKYIVKPPKGCPITPKNTYLLLKKTLYGLRRSPRHCYETFKKTLLSMDLKPLPNAPCIFTGTLLKGEAPIYIGIFVDDFIYFSTSSAVKEQFKQQLGDTFKTDFHDNVTHFLGLNFQCTKDKDGHVDIFINQQVDAEELMEKANLHHASTQTAKTPYRSGHPVDTIPYDDTISPADRNEFNHTLQEYTGSLNWLSRQTRPDLATIPNIISQYNTKATPAHINAAKYAIRYLKGTSQKGILFSSRSNHRLNSFLQFPLDPSKLTPACDANWGPQDASTPNPDATPIELDLFKSRSIAGFLIWLGGPVHWQSKRQSYAARSSTEAEIGATDDCTKALQHIRNILLDLDLLHLFSEGPITIYNNNAAALQWSHNMTTKGLKHIQLRENALRESVQSGVIEVEHIGGKTNPSDIFTKEDRDVQHFTDCRDTMVVDPPSLSINIDNKPCSEPTAQILRPSGFCEPAAPFTMTSQTSRGV